MHGYPNFLFGCQEHLLNLLSSNSFSRYHPQEPDYLEMRRTYAQKNK